MCSRIGLRYKVICPDIVLDQGTFKCTSTFEYLGVSVLSGKHFLCDYFGARRKFFGSFIPIYGRVGSKYSTSLLLSLFSSVCTPALSYGVKAALGGDKMELKKLCHSYDTT